VLVRQHYVGCLLPILYFLIVLFLTFLSIYSLYMPYLRIFSYRYFICTYLLSFIVCVASNPLLPSFIRSFLLQVLTVLHTCYLLTVLISSSSCLQSFTLLVMCSYLCLSSFLSYMSFFLYPGHPYVRTYCLTVIPLCTSFLLTYRLQSFTTVFLIRLLSSFSTYMYLLLYPRLSFVPHSVLHTCCYLLLRSFLATVSLSILISFLVTIFSYVRYFYMYFSLYPGPYHVRTYCLTVMLLCFSHYPYLLAIYNPLLSCTYLLFISFYSLTYVLLYFLAPSVLVRTYCHTVIRYFTLTPIYTYVQSFTFTCYILFLHVYLMVPRPIPCPVYVLTVIPVYATAHLLSSYLAPTILYYLFYYLVLAILLTYMSYLLYPGPSSVPTYCLTVIPLYAFAHSPYLMLPTILYFTCYRTSYPYLACLRTCLFPYTPAIIRTYILSYIHATMPI
jgi:hypothetical protein